MKGFKPAPKGHPKWGGRKKGTGNKLDKTIKEMVLGALSDVGGQAYLAQCAIKQPVAFLALVGRVLPLQLAGTGRDGEAVPISFEWAKATPPAGLIEGSVVKDVDPISDIPEREAAD